MQRAWGGVRLVAQYEAFGRASSMVFFFRTPRGIPPTWAECRAVADAYGSWENNGLGIGYCLLRSDDSHYVNVAARSIDGRNPVAFEDVGFDRTGEVPGFVSPMLPTGIAPLCRWGTAERGAATGRTYLTGVSEGVCAFGADQSYLGADAGATMQIVMDNLRQVVLSATGYVQVHYTASARGGLGFGGKLLDITDSGMYNLLASRRLRTRP